MKKPANKKKNDEKALFKKFAILGVAFILILIIVLAIVYAFALKRTPKDSADGVNTSVTESAPPEEVIESAVYYDITNGFTHSLYAEELTAFKKLLKNEIPGIEIEFGEYNEMLESISNNTADSVQFLEFSSKDGNISYEIMNYNGILYLESTKEEGKIYRLVSDNEYTMKLSDYMNSLKMLNQMEVQ